MKINHTLLKRYRKIAKRWGSEEYAGIRRDDMIPKLIKLMELENLAGSSKVLDVMCGTGIVEKTIITELKKIGASCQLYFLDFSREMLDQINISLTKIIEADVRSIPFPDNYFDRIILRGSLHDLDKESQQEAIREIFRVLKQDGVFVLSGFCASKENQFYYNLLVNYKDELSGHKDANLERYFPTKGEYEILLKEAGFTISEITLEYISTITYWKEGELGEKYEKWKFFMLNFPKHVREQMNIREMDGFLSYDFPVAVFVSRK